MSTLKPATFIFYLVNYWYMFVCHCVYVKTVQSN